MQGFHPQFNMLGVPSMLGFVCKPDMPPHINILFRARPPMEWIPMPKKTTKKYYSGIFDPNANKNIMDLFEKTAPPKKDAELSKYQEKLKKIVENVEKNRAENKEKIKQFKLMCMESFRNPKEDPNVHGDAYKTLFVYRLNYKTDEKRLQRKFEFYGPIKRIRIVKDFSGKSRGYAFIEYEHKSDFSNAYKRGDRERIDDKIVYTDFERGRTEKGFKSRRFGGHFPQETRPLPAWLLKDLKTFKEIHPDIVEEIKAKHAPVKEVKENKNYENKENKEFEGIGNLANGNNSRSRSRERENKDKDKEREKDRDKERARKHRSKSRSRSRSRSRDKKRSKRHNLSPTPKRDLSNLVQVNNNNYNEIETLEENNNNLLSSKENLNFIGSGDNDANMMPNGLEGGEIKDANGNGNYNKEYEEDSDYTDKRRSKKEKKEKKDKKHKKDKKSKKDKKEKKEKKEKEKEKRERKESVEVGEIV